MADDGAFADLRRLSDWFARSTDARSALRIERSIQLVARRLGKAAVPLLGRELRNANAIRREAAREGLAMLAVDPPDEHARARVIAELRTIATDDSVDEAKVCALGLLAELGEHAAARFRDPSAMQRRSALALAAQLDTPADVASAVHMMVRQLSAGDIRACAILDVLVEAAPPAAHHLATELALRLDVDAAIREHARDIVDDTALVTRELPRTLATDVAVLVDAAARIVVVATRRCGRSRSARWRRWAVLIGSTGCIEDCLHEDDGPEGAGGAPLVANLCADGYRIASTELDHARTVVASAVRRTTRGNQPLAPAYYLGRDLLDLRDAHVIQPPRVTATALARAVELLADGDSAGARALLERGASPVTGEAAGILAACLLAQGDIAGAIEPLERAIAHDPAWPLHHYNLALAQLRLDNPSASHAALRRFIQASAVPTGLAGDPDQPARVAAAERMLADLERSARLAGKTLARKPRRRSKKRSS